MNDTKYSFHFYPMSPTTYAGNCVLSSSQNESKNPSSICSVGGGQGSSKINLVCDYYNIISSFLHAEISKRIY